MTATLVARTRVYDGWYTLDRVALRVPGGHVVERHIEDHGHAASVLPYDPARRVALLVSMPRAPVVAAGAADVLETIAGNIDDGDPQATARREALEEAGVRLDALEWVANVWSLVALSTERVMLYLAPYAAADRIADGGGIPEDGEVIRVHEMPLATLAALADAGTLDDAKTLLLVQTLRLRRPDLFG